MSIFPRSKRKSAANAPASEGCRPTFSRGSDDAVSPTRRQRFWLAMFVLLASALGCSAADLFERPAPTPPPTRALAPTFTPTPEDLSGVIIVTPPFNGTPGVIIVPPGTDPKDVIPLPPVPTEMPAPTAAAPALTASALPAESSTAVATETPLPTLTSTETASPIPSNTPTPFVIVENGLVALRSGPGVEFPLVAQLGPGIPIAITGQNPEGTWFQLCCVNGTNVWVAGAHVLINNDPHTVALLAGATPPSPTPTFPPTPTGTATFTPTATPYPFQRTIGPQFFPTENKFLTIWVKLHIGTLRLFTGCDPDLVTPDKESPAPGYFLKVLFNGFERPPTNGVQQSTDKFSCSASVGAGNRFEYNIKYEYMPPDPSSLNIPASTPTPRPEDLLGNGTWTIYVIDGVGNQLSPAETFTTQSNNPNREVYIAWERTR